MPEQTRKGQLTTTTTKNGMHNDTHNVLFVHHRARIPPKPVHANINFNPTSSGPLTLFPRGCAPGIVACQSALMPTRQILCTNPRKGLHALLVWAATNVHIGLMCTAGLHVLACSLQAQRETVTHGRWLRHSRIPPIAIRPQNAPEENRFGKPSCSKSPIQFQLAPAVPASSQKSDNTAACAQNPLPSCF